LAVYDYIIVGQGLAGTALAVELLNKGARICMFNDQAGESSSRVAAGLYNPVTGRKMVKTWRADDLFPVLEDFYREAERRTSRSFLHDLPIYRPFLSVEEQNEWMGKSASDEYSAYISDIRTAPHLSWGRDPFGGVVLKRSGFLDIPNYLDGMREYFLPGIYFEPKSLNYNELKVGTNEVAYNGIRAGAVVFCEGTQVMNNPWFSWLPFRPVKGEVIDIEMDVQTMEILNRHVFVLPLSRRKFRVGSTYDNNDHTWVPTSAGREKIQQQLEKLIDVPYTILDQRAGIRPATADRRPIIGRHPEYETIFLLNGLGTKGVSLSPYFARQLTNCLKDHAEPDNEVNINRYFSLY